MALAPTANQISVREVLAKFNAEFAAMAHAVENGEFALWVGSGISRQAPNLGNLIEQAFDYIRERAVHPATAAAYLPALEEALGLAEIDPATVQAQYPQPLAAWPEHDAVISRLWTKYSRVLDIRVPGTDADFILWEAIDIRRAFDDPAPPAAEHLCIAVLILEGAVQAVTRKIRWTVGDLPGLGGNSREMAAPQGFARFRAEIGARRITWPAVAAGLARERPYGQRKTLTEQVNG